MRDLGVRANADTPGEARTAREFRVDGLGLCRTEHMFFDAARIMVMREMILADTDRERQAALDQLLPMQRADFIEIFEIMRGLPVTIRLLDPPLHEFLPKEEEDIAALAEAMGLPVAAVTARARDLAEVNPMLGMRGVRLGVVMPAIYEMQARAIFEAAIAVNRDAPRAGGAGGDDPAGLGEPRGRARQGADRRHRRRRPGRAGRALPYRLGVMVETPRAALRAEDLAASSAFLSFGTNDLTQMTYGLSRDDAGRFMRDYVNAGVFPEDPFLSLDLEGVGELLLIAAKRGRARNPGLVLGLCGEHGGDPSSVRFCKLAGFDYVSCSPYRVPIARLAAAQATLLVRGAGGGGRGMRPLPGDLAALAAGGKAALARTLSALETAPEDPGLVGLLDAAWAGAAGLVLGLTGPPGRRQVDADQRARRRAARPRRDGGGDRRRPLVAALGRRAPRRPDADRDGPGGPRRLRPLDGGAATARRHRRHHLPGGGADAGGLRLGGGRDRRRRPVGDRDRRLRRPRGLLRAARVRGRAPVHEGRGHGGA